MANTVLNEFLSELKSSQLVHSDCDEIELFNQICEKGDTRLEILQCLMSKFSKYYAEQLQNTSDVKLELMRILNDLHFTNTSNKMTFVTGDCSIEEQKQIFNEIFKMLKFVTLGHTTERIRTFEDFDFTEKEHLDMQLKKTPINNLNKEFDLNQAMQTLEEAGKLLQNFSFITKKDHSAMRGESIAAGGAEVCDACNSYKQCLGDLESRLLQRPTGSQQSSEELASQVGRLHCTLKTITASLCTSS